MRALGAVLALWIVATAVGWLAVPSLSHTPATIWKNSSLIPPFEQPARTPDYLLRGLWQRYDTLWYRRIAERGYEPISTPFYPLLPAMTAGFSRMGIPPAWGVLLASRIAAWLAIWGLLRLAAGDHDELAARRAVLYWLCWPMSFILLAGYSEPCLVAGMVWSLVFARDRRWWPAAVCAVATCLSRSTGVALLPALYWIGWRQRPLRPVPLALATAGPLLYPGFLLLQGLPLPSEVYPFYWRTTVSAPWTTLAAALRALGTGHAGFVIFNLGAIALTALFVFASRLRTEYKLLSAGMILFLLTANTTPPLHSMMRYSLAVFPAFVALAEKARESWAVLLTASVFGMLNLLLLYFFFDWAYVV